MGNLFSLNRDMLRNNEQLTQEQKKLYNNLVGKIPQQFPSGEKGLVDTLIRLRGDSFKEECKYFKKREKGYSKTFLDEELKELFGYIKEKDEKGYINFFSNKDGNFFKRLLLDRKLSEEEENFIDFLYSKEVIKGLSSDMIVRFDAETFNTEGYVGTGSAITLPQLFNGIRNTILNEALDAWNEIEEETAEIYTQELLKKIVQAFDDVELVLATTGSPTKGSVQKRSTETVSAKKLLELEYGIYVEDSDPRKLFVVNDAEKAYFKDISAAARSAKSGSTGSTKAEINADVSKATRKALDESMIKYLKDKKVILSEDKNASEYFYTPFFLNSDEFKKILSKLTDAKSFIDQKAQESKGEVNEEKNNFSSFSEFLTYQLNNASGFNGAKIYWNDFLKENPDFIDKLNKWGKGYSNGANVIGHIGEHFAKYYLRNNSTIFGQNKNNLGQDAHVDIGSLQTGFQVKNYSGAVNSFHLYDSDTSVFGRTITRYISPNFLPIDKEEIIVSLRYISANKNILNGNDVSNTIKNFLGLNFDYWTRYDDAESNFDELQGMKNNFFVLNFKLIPSSLIFQQLINKINEANKEQYFNLDKFYMQETDELEKSYDLYINHQDLNKPHFGRVIFKGFKFNIAGLANTKFENKKG